MMMKILNGSDLAGFIKERQARGVRGLRQAGGIAPQLAIVQVKDDPVINTYVKLKEEYGADILVDVTVHRPKQNEVPALLAELNEDAAVHGIILQLPLEDTAQTDELCDLVAPEKDVDALGKNAVLDPATPMAITWLLAGYNIELRGRKIVIIGNGKLVGKPLAKLLNSSGYDVTVADRSTQNLSELTLQADIIITAAGSPALLFSAMIKHGAVIVDAGVASEDGKTVGDVAQEVYDRDDLTITPVKGGVGPLTVTALFENVITAARGSAQD